MDFEYEAPFISPNRITEEKKPKKKKKGKKKIRVSKYAIDVNNLTSKDLQDTTFWNLDLFPVDPMGEFVTHSRAEFVRLIQEKIRVLYKKMKQRSGNVEYPKIVNAVLDEIGCNHFWSRGKIHSELSKNIQARRKEKKELVLRRKLDEARQAELALGISEKE